MSKWLIRWAAVIGATLPIWGQTPVRNPHGALTIACQNCHTTTSWSPLRAKPEFNHNTDTHYPLRGMHVDVACNSCHVSKVFTEAGTQCADCHADFHKRQFGAQCENCHTVNGWRVNTRAAQDHWNRFPLLGAHATVTCDSCHPGAATGTYTGLSTECISCHARDFQTPVLNHAAAGFPTTCENCHNMVQWQVARFDHTRFTNFPLTGVHQNLACASCHAGGRFQGTPAECFSCHAKDFSGSTNPNHIAAGFSQNCAQCHNTSSWAVTNFDHNLTKFPLTGGHVGVACATCHVNNQFSNLSTACVSCHLKDMQGANNPNHVAAGFPQDCSLCHSTVNWTSAAFNHNTTKFPLTGAHTTVACASCHVNNQFATLSTDCVSCHLKDMQGTTNPNHVAAGFPQNCSLCHTTADWTSATFNHNTTKFPLTGKHTTVACATCHVNNQFATLSTDCVSCHLKDMQGTTDPNHVAAGFPQDCSLCHSTADWTGATFNHNTTKFPLTGKHTTVACAACHVNNQFATLSTDCVSCHLKDMQGTTDPNHVAAGFPQDCSLCHSTVDWTGATFNHNTTKFPLTGKHTTVACATCHVNNQFATLSTDCVSCHLKDMQGTTNPSHVAAAFPTDCSLCHTTVDWSGATFNHSTQTKFPLTGAHASVGCTTCHVNNQFASLSTACVSCHMKDWQSTNNPNHAAAGFPQDCSVCHSTTNWLGATFDHTTQTKFPLTGKHTTVACGTCHVNNQFATLSTACVSCHLKDLQGTTNPNHVAAGFPQDCQVCHTTVDWSGATFNHNATKFPLTGAHQTVQCATCHVNGQYAALSTDCVSCHAKDWQSTNNPSHAAAGFPQDCSLCHSTTNWANATFNHTTQTKFPLTGKHTTVACAACHVNNQFATLSTACVSCHLKDMQSTTNPNHVAAGFPQDCSVCHSTTDWLNATFNHNNTPFPLTGKHTTVACATCHVNNQYATLPTTCISCHQKDWQSATNPNHIAAGFPQDCSLCHSTTDFLSATFNHNTTAFPLTGKHTTVACATCHVNNQYATLPTTCISCHQKDWQSTTNPNHVAAGFPQDCSLCHSTTDFLSATFNHNTTPFPLTGKHTTVACATCHVNNQYATLPTTCISCHQKDWQSATNPNHVAAGFPQDCSLCHSTTDFLSATFNHNTTPFPLTGKHTTVACATCHVNNQYATLPTTCISCHQKDWQSTTNPNHVAAGFPQDCSLCHSTTDFLSATFNHNTTPFPLTGKHTTVACATCHVNNQFATLPTTCISCHQTDWQGTNNPNHTAAGFPQDCSLCHSTTDWTGATFNHNTTPFPLTGAHTTVACATCHVNNQFATLPTTCVSCHLKDMQGATNPNHVSAGFPQDCSVCHTTTNWTSATFNHASTGFTLTGAHTTLACSQCHVNNNFTLTSAACINCHTSDWSSTNNPPHAAAGFPQDCSQCHTTTNWAGATFNHSSTGFALTGAHTALACNLCHVSNNFSLTSGACYPCHVATYNSTMNPNHAQLGYPQDCSMCHSTTDWTSSTFNHSTTSFPLTGKHATTACAQCHVGGKFAGTPTDCYSCHATEYNSTTNPNHAAAGFPKTCNTCHSFTDWTGATFTHTWFPTNHGNANGVCSTCHTNSNDYSIFSCTGCHLKPQTDNNHSGVRNYVYNSVNCYSCHPNGRGG